MTNSIAIIDYGMGNIRSVQNAFSSLGHATVLVSEPDDVAKSDRLVLPGVGAFEEAMQTLLDLNLADALTEFVNTGRPVLGICLGMQLMCTTSNENGSHTGLGWIDAEVAELSAIDFGLNLPHMGWNEVNFEKDHPLITGIPNGSDYYFVHSFKVVCREAANVLATTDYGEPFTCMLEKDNIVGAQFHPEKSQQPGLQIIDNFVNNFLK